MSDQFDHLDRAELIGHAGNPTIRARLLDDEGNLVDLTTGYQDFQAVVVRRNRPLTAVLTIGSGVTGDEAGFLIPAHAIVALDARYEYVLTATATETASGEDRRAMGIVSILPAPAPV